MQEVIIEIDERGNATIEAKGFEGAECKLLTKAIEDALGDVEKVVEKPEFRRARPVVRKAGA
jgi:hypothetical protein